MEDIVFAYKTFVIKGGNRPGYDVTAEKDVDTHMESGLEVKALSFGLEHSLAPYSRCLVIECLFP